MSAGRMLDFYAFEVRSKEEDDLSASEIWFPPERMLAKVVDEREDDEQRSQSQRVAPQAICSIATQRLPRIRRIEIGSLSPRLCNHKRKTRVDTVQKGSGYSSQYSD